MKKYAHAILITTALSVIGVNAEVDCIALSQSVSLKVSSDKSQVLEIVSKEIAAAPSCACEIVKAAIKSSKANNELVGQIVETAISVAPEQRDTIVKCATSAAPDAYLEIKMAAAASRADGQNNNPLNVPGINPLASPLSSFTEGGGAGGTTGGGGGIGAGGLGSLLGRLPAGGLPGGFFGATPGGSGNPGLGGGGGGGGIINPPVTTIVNPVGFPIPPVGPPGPPNPPRP